VSLRATTASPYAAAEESRRASVAHDAFVATASTSVGARTLRIRVVAENNAGPPIPGCEVYLEARSAGVTDRNGALTIEVDTESSEAIVLRVGPHGFAPVELELDLRESLTEPIVVVLVKESFLHGQVRIASGEAPRSLVRVACSRSDRWPDAAVMELAFAGVPTPRIRVVDAAADGSFVIGGLEAGLSYMLMPFSCGYTPNGDFPVATTMDSPVTLIVAPLFGALVVVRGPGGSELPTSPHLLGGGPGWDSTLPSGAEGLFPTPAQVSLIGRYCAGESAPFMPSGATGSWASTLLLFAGGEGHRVEEASAVDFGVHVPGCEPVNERIPVAWLGHGLQRTTVIVRALTDCFGTIQVPSQLPLPAGWKAPGVLTLRSEFSKESYAYPIDVADPSSLVVEGVPCGEYRVSFAARDSLYRWSMPSDATLLRVGNSGAASLAPLVAPELGALEVHFVGSKDEEYDGSVVFSLEFGEGASTIGQSVEFFEGPYRVGLVPPGSWYVRVIQMNGERRPLEPRTPVEVVTGGAVSRAFVPLAKQ